MKIRVDIDEKYEGEIIIQVPFIDETVSKIQNSIRDIITEKRVFECYKGERNYYVKLENILFFETTEKFITVHTVDDMFQTKYRLYELEEKLPGFFMRVSKSAILNINHIYSITKNLTASSVVEFNKTHKKVYVSRYYYKALKSRLEEKRISS